MKSKTKLQKEKKTKKSSTPKEKRESKKKRKFKKLEKKQKKLKEKVKMSREKLLLKVNLQHLMQTLIKKFLITCLKCRTKSKNKEKHLKQ